ATCGGSGQGCAKTCKYELLLTETARQEIFGLNIMVRCMKRYESDDPNCREDAAEEFSTESPGGDDKGDGTAAHWGDPLAGCFCRRTKVECRVEASKYDSVSREDQS
ncbi:MAG TPA: hypothetical protein VM285_06135, partial [Polyangia bacterium]|nr:hypothetical protein [Polyangia bacterium]